MVSVARGHFFSIAITVPGDPASAVAVPLAGPRWSAGQFSASTQTSCGRVYALEYKNTLTATNWLALPLVAGNGEVQIIRDGGAVAPQRFYRLLKW